MGVKVQSRKYLKTQEFTICQLWDKQHGCQQVAEESFGFGPEVATQPAGRRPASPWIRARTMGETVNTADWCVVLPNGILRLYQVVVCDAQRFFTPVH